ncbi:hypothetical protein FACS189491_08940 [Spirochaetia bacterium]|nr:hypothetical protein FACS189491_08940 [Spirochaetia bacterium]
MLALRESDLDKENREQERIDQKGRNIVFYSWLIKSVRKHFLYYSARMLDKAEAVEITRTTFHLKFLA